MNFQFHEFLFQGTWEPKENIFCHDLVAKFEEQIAFEDQYSVAESISVPNSKLKIEYDDMDNYSVSHMDGVDYSDGENDNLEDPSEFLNDDSMEPENGNKSFKCERCDKTFATNRNLKRHMSNIHEGHKDFQCENCHRFFGQKDELKRHKCKDLTNDSMEPENNGNNKSFKCERCDKTFTADRNLKRHIYIVHEGNKNFLCELCQKMFGFKQLLERHMKIKHNIKVIKNDTKHIKSENPSEQISDQSLLRVLCSLGLMLKYSH